MELGSHFNLWRPYLITPYQHDYITESKVVYMITSLSKPMLCPGEFVGKEMSSIDRQ